MRVALVLLVLTGVVVVSEGRILSRCEVAARLFQLGAKRKQLAWVCIAQTGSAYNTKAVNINRNGSKDYGIFQINNRYWCDKPRNAGCRLKCSALQDSDIADDFQCAQQIYKESARMSVFRGDGFNAWTTYKTKCSRGRAEKYLYGC